MTEFIFTFGFGQTNPSTGASRSRRFTRIEAEDSEAARVLMVERFGRQWAFMYYSEEEAGVSEFGLIELAIRPCFDCDGSGTDYSHALDAVPNRISGEPEPRGPEPCDICHGTGAVEVELPAIQAANNELQGQ